MIGEKIKEKKMMQRVAALGLAGTLLLNFPGQSSACGPDFAQAIIVNGIHPDLPLKLFASGKLGIIQAGWAQSYLIVAYRYLSGKALDQNEQQSIANLWQKRLNITAFADADIRDECLEYFKLRARVLKEKWNKNASRWDMHYADNVGDNAFANATKNLNELIKKYGEQSSAVKNWLQDQDRVFGVNNTRTQSEPPAQAKLPDPYLKAQKQYQIAAAKFYRGDLLKAKELFENSALLPGNPIRDLCSYMAARAIATSAVSSSDTSPEDAITYIQKLINAGALSKYKSDLIDLYEMLEYQLNSPASSLESLCRDITSMHSTRFGNNVADLTSMFDRNLYQPGLDNDETKKLKEKTDFPIEKYELSDWLITIQQADQNWVFLSVDEQKELEKKKQEKAAHALERWRTTHSLPWLVASMSWQDLSRPSNADLRKAAAQLKPESPAYLTAQFYLVDALLKEKKKTEARKMLNTLLSIKDIPPSSRNLFLFQRLSIADRVTEFLQSAVERPVAISLYNDERQLPEHWYYLDNRQSYYTENPAIGSAISRDINCNLPQSCWLAWSRDKSTAPELSKQILRAAWLRSKLLAQDAGLDEALAKAYPQMKNAMRTYLNAPAGPEKDFALAALILKYYGMSPYLGAGVERHLEKIDEFDYYQTNFWLPMPSLPQRIKEGDWEPFNSLESGLYFLGSARMKKMIESYTGPRLDQILTTQEKKDVNRERALINKNHPSRFLGEAVLRHAKLNPADPRNPEMLYRIVKLPRWSGTSSTGSQYSKQAYQILHKQYSRSSWAKKAECWY